MQPLADTQPRRASVAKVTAAAAPKAAPLRDPGRTHAAHTRGPMRPEGLATTRRRLNGVSIARQLRLLDMAVVLALLPLAVVGAGRAFLDVPARLFLPPALGAALVLASLRLTGVYDLSARESLQRHLFRTALAGVFGTAPAVWLTYAFGSDITAVSRWALGVAGVLMVVHAFDWGMVRRWRRAGRLTPNVVVVGATANARRFIETALEAGDAAVLGVFDDRMSRIPKAVNGVPVLGDTDSLLSHRLLPFIDHIIITVTPSAQRRVGELVDRLKFLPNAVTLFMEFEGLDAQRRALTRLGAAPLAHVSGEAEDASRAAAKRVQDIVLSGALLVLAGPLMLVIAALIRLDDGGPALFRQRRHGFNNETINVLKFRTMRVDGADQTQERQVTAGDCRVTRLGRILRPLSLDELPQLWNVFCGEMSLVGPRPHAIGMKAAGKDAARLVSEYAWRHRMKPGLTGWAQVNGSIGPVDTPELVRRRVALDIDYIERQSLAFDLAIIALTPLALVRALRLVR